MSAVQLAWVYLLIAGCFEIVFTTCLKFSDNFKQLPWTIAFVIAAVFSFYFLSKSVETLPLGTAYAVWTGIGAFGTAIVGIILFQDSTSFWRVFFLMLLIFSVIGLKLFSR